MDGWIIIYFELMGGPVSFHFSAVVWVLQDSCAVGFSFLQRETDAIN